MGELIVRKARELFFHYGIKSISKDQFARSSGISKRTIYQSVEHKNELVEKVVDQLLNNYTKLLSESLDGGVNAIEEVVSASCLPFISLASINQSFFYDLEKHYPRTWFRLQGYKSTQLLPAILGNLRRGGEEGMYRTNLDIGFTGQYRLQQISSALNPLSAGIPRTDSLR